MISFRREPQANALAFRSPSARDETKHQHGSAMFVIRPRCSWRARDLCPIAWIAAVFLFSGPGGQALASTIGGSLRLTDADKNRGPSPWYLSDTPLVSYVPPTSELSTFGSTISKSWYLTNTNSTNYNFQNGAHYLQVTLSVDSSHNATFNVHLLSPLTDNSYVIDQFAFNWGGNSAIRDRLQTAISNSNAPLNRWSVRGANGESAVNMNGMGKYDYLIDARTDNNRTESLSFTLDLSGLGLTKEEILQKFQVLTSGSDGSGFFAVHVSTGGENDWCNQCVNDSFYAAGADPAPSFAPNWGKGTPPATSINPISPTALSVGFGTGMGGLVGSGGGGGFNPMWSNIFGTGSGRGGGLGGGGSSGSSSSSPLVPNIDPWWPTPPGPTPPGPNPPGPPPPGPPPPTVPEPSSLVLMGWAAALLLPVLAGWRPWRRRPGAQTHQKS